MCRRESDLWRSTESVSGESEEDDEETAEENADYQGRLRGIGSQDDHGALPTPGGLDGECDVAVSNTVSATEFGHVIDQSGIPSLDEANANGVDEAQSSDKDDWDFDLAADPVQPR